VIKADLAKVVYERHGGISFREAKDVVELILRVMKGSLVVGENVNFGGNEEFLRSRGVEVIMADDKDCIDLMQRFITEKPELWAEDIAED
jgi:hypothetical protein